MIKSDKAVEVLDKGLWYKAKVISKDSLDTGFVEVEFNKGEKVELVALSRLRPAPKRIGTDVRPVINEEVEVDLDECWIPGTIHKVKGAKDYTIKLNNGNQAMVHKTDLRYPSTWSNNEWVEPIKDKTNVQKRCRGRPRKVDDGNKKAPKTPKVAAKNNKRQSESATRIDDAVNKKPPPTPQIAPVNKKRPAESEKETETGKVYKRNKKTNETENESASDQIMEDANVPSSPEKMNKDSDENADMDTSSAINKKKKKLLVLDINGVLLHAVELKDVPKDKSSEFVRIGRKAVFWRPFFQDFLNFCFENFEVGIWSSKHKKNIDKFFEKGLGDLTKKLKFCWDMAYCTDSGDCCLDNNEKPLVFKNLNLLWNNDKSELPWKKGDFNETNTVLIDDSPYKALLNPSHTAIFPYSYDCHNEDDTSLGANGDLRTYLERIVEAENVQEFIKNNPFGQEPITEASKDWDFYSDVIKKMKEGAETRNDPNQDVGGSFPDQSGKDSQEKDRHELNDPNQKEENYMKIVNETVEKVLDDINVVSEDDENAEKSKSEAAKKDVQPEHVAGYNPFNNDCKEEYTILKKYLDSLKEEKKNPGKHTSTYWYSVLTTPKSWLFDTHIDAAINLLRLRYQTHPEWFRSERMCFLDTVFTSMWCGAYQDFKNLELPPPLAGDYCGGQQPEFCKSDKAWGKDVDDIYTCLNITGKHWVALWISIPERKVVIWDCYQKADLAEDIATLVNCLCEMIPSMLHILSPVEERHVFSNVPYTQHLLPKDQVPQNARPGDCGLFCMKFIECHALGLPFSSKDFCDRNMISIRIKLAAEIYAELKTTGKEKRDYKGLDLYDSRK